MRRLETEVLVIGGGATGTGVLRDLAMRGFRAILVEQNDLAYGTTGRYHGLLHSGARYVVRDPQTAVECIQENRILRRIMPHCIEDIGGFFVVTPWDDEAFVPQFLEGCRKADIPVEEISTAQMLREEPRLNPRITRCFRVPDGAADSFRAAEANVASARAYGARAFTYHRVEQLLVSAGRVSGAVCRDLIRDEEVTIYADVVVNAAGAWAGRIAALAGLNVPMRCGKGTMVAINHRVLNTVVNRCRPPSDGDIIVPTHSVAVIGTTDVPVDDPDAYPIEPWEVHLMLTEGAKLLPGLPEMRILRAWAGVRPLYAAEPMQHDRGISRGHVLLDHAARDGVAGLITIVGGKWTTYRLMAQDTVDLVCRLLGTPRACRTHLEALPAVEKGHRTVYHILGAPLAHVEEQKVPGALVCECELATRDAVERAIATGDVTNLDDLRRDVRLGMGPCQGGFCSYRAAGIMHRMQAQRGAQSIQLWHAFVQQRWKGLLPVVCGDQLRQMRLNELLYRTIFSLDRELR
ncbi:MAG: anaerobic glycerol-3-phosphate dehydrogenase subunit GlpA [Anaerolineae bacterium]|nr:anaerobic glycerol-3-phosphate dehydrogenase subunit GlpA [Anaerolineae bacterium]MDW8070967.1 anaerobic glycerol-3-phosphate dehydrogenase subunit GlpA [Anaerolineae bacterium]